MENIVSYISALNLKRKIIKIKLAYLRHKFILMEAINYRSNQLNYKFELILIE